MSTFYFDTKVVERIIPNFDGEGGTSLTYTVILKDGKQIKHDCKGPKDFKDFEDKIKDDKKYKDLKAKIDKEKI